MFRSSIIYRRWWYFRKHRAKSIHICLKLIFISIILAFLIFYAQKRLFPCVYEISEARIRTDITRIADKIIRSDSNYRINYEDFADVKRAADGRIASIHTDMVRMNKVSAKISSGIEEELALCGYGSISLPAGALLGNTAFEGLGPQIHIKLLPMGKVQANLKAGLTKAGMNQEKYSIYLQVISQVKIQGASLDEKHTVVTDIPIMETIIVGGSGNTYLDEG